MSKRVSYTVLFFVIVILNEHLIVTGRFCQILLYSFFSIEMAYSDIVLRDTLSMFVE